MANTTIYPYGTGGQLPSSIGVINDLTTGGADKALSAEMGKNINEELHGKTESYSRSAGNQYYSITNNVLNINSPVSNGWIASLVIEVTAGQTVAWHGGTYQLAGYHKFIFAACDSQYNVLSSSTSENGTYTITEDGYVVVQGWSAGTNATTASVMTNGLEQSKANVSDITSLVNAQIGDLPYSDDLVAQCKFYGGGKITSGVLVQDYYAKYSGYIRIAPATKMLAKKVSSMYADFPIISYYSEPIEKAYINEEDVTTSDISSTGTIIIAPDTAKYMRLCFGLYGNSYDSFTIQLENASFLRCLTEIQRPFKFILPKYVDGVTGRNVYLFTSQFMDGVEGYYLRSGGSIRRVPGGEDVWSLSSETNVVLCDNDGSLREGFTRNSDSSLQHFNLKVRLNSKTNGDGSTKGILFIGDSLMENGPSVREAYDLLDADGDWTIQKIGTSKNMGVGEFTQGWKYSDFIGSSSPFYINGALNFQAYVAAKHQSYTGGIDYVIIALGTNDVNGTGISTIIANAKTLIDAILNEDTGYPNAKIAVGLPSLGAPYASTNNDTDFTNHYSFKKKMRALNTALISNFDNGKYNANVTCMAHGAYLYAYESYGHTDVAVNQYCETTARQFGSFMKDGVSADTIHPYHIGFKQWGYAFYCKIRAFLAGNL